MSAVFTEMKIKPSWKTTAHPPGWALSNGWTIKNVREDTEKSKPFYSAGENNKNFNILDLTIKLPHNKATLLDMALE